MSADDGNAPMTPSGSPTKKRKFRSSIQPVPSPSSTLNAPSGSITGPSQVTSAPQTLQPAAEWSQSNAMTIDTPLARPNQGLHVPLFPTQQYTPAQLWTAIPPTDSTLPPILMLTLPFQQSVGHQLSMQLGPLPSTHTFLPPSMSDMRGSSGMVTPSTHTFLPLSVSDMRVPSHMVMPSQMPVSTTGQSVTFPLATSRGSRTSNWSFGMAAPSSSMPSGHSANHN
ncbi:hypothetical protein FRB95_005367 [Tulasnella sp. JGI-2019a]|nr:hypothetical protein FRB95_005367 [Tulasnella sp. JGI-2019a]